MFPGVLAWRGVLPLSHPHPHKMSIVYGTKTKAWADWHKALEASLAGRDEEAFVLMDALFSDKVEFKPPTYFKTRKSKPFTLMALKGVSKLFVDFKYVREFIGDGDVALEFEARCGAGGPLIHGIDLIKFDSEGKIVEMAVLARPPSAVQAIADHQAVFMKEFLASQSKL